jgi:hypothetical protein
VLGRRIVIDGEAREIIGIMPQTFGFMNRNIAVILPFQLDRSKVFIGNFSFLGIARLKSGVTLAQAKMSPGCRRSCPESSLPLRA